MKLTFRQIEPFVKSPDPATRTVLIYGPDQGLVTERSEIIAKSVVEDLSDPFQVASLTPEAIAEDPVRLNDEAFAQSLMGGDRLLRIRGAADALKPHLAAYLKDPSPHCLVLVEAGELGPRSSLRLLFEKDKNAVALPCYVEGERDLANVIRDMISESGHGIDRDAQALLAGSIVGDRVQARSEIEKLILYKGMDDNSPINADDVRASVGAVRALSIDEFVHAAASGDLPTAMRLYRTMLQEATAPQAMLRFLQNHMRRLYAVKAALEAGDSLDQAMKTLNPPIFFKWADSFKSQVRNWPIEKLDNALNSLIEIEISSKQGRVPIIPLCGDLIFRITQKAF